MKTNLSKDTAKFLTEMHNYGRAFVIVGAAMVAATRVALFAGKIRAYPPPEVLPAPTTTSNASQGPIAVPEAS